MKLSELSTDRVADVLCTIAPCIENIVLDEEFMEEMKTLFDFAKAKTVGEKFSAIASKFAKLVPLLLKKRKEDVFVILSAINEKSVEEIGKQNILVTMSEVRELTKDKELLDFFKSCTDTEESE